VSFDFTAPSGKKVHYELPYEKLIDLSEFPARVRSEFDVDAIETVGSQFAGLADPEIDRFADALTASNVRLMNVSVDAGDLLDSDPERRAGSITMLKRWIDRFIPMAPTFVRVNAGFPANEHTGEPPARHLVEALVELGEYTRDRGSRLLVENHGGPSSDPVWIGALLDAVGPELLGLLLDLGNFEALTGPLWKAIFSGEPFDAATVFTGLDLSSVYDSIDALADRAELVHVKAHEVTGDSIGVIDLPRALGILAAHGYNGPLSVEYEGNGGDPWQKIGRVVEVTRQAILSPAGADGMPS
jgi:sugar phosphate isomerase/epimerase